MNTTKYGQYTDEWYPPAMSGNSQLSLLSVVSGGLTTLTPNIVPSPILFYIIPWEPFIVSPRRCTLASHRCRFNVAVYYLFPKQ